MRRFFVPGVAILIQGGLVLSLFLFRWMILAGGEPFVIPAVVEESTPDPRIPEVTLRFSPPRMGGEGEKERSPVAGEIVRVPVGGGRGTFIRGLVGELAESRSSFEVVIQSFEGTRSIYTTSWFPFREGETIFGCVDGRGVLQYLNRIDSEGECWDKGWRRIEGKAVSVRETRGGRVTVRYGMEGYHPPPGVKIPPAGSEVWVEGVVRWGFPVITGIGRPGG